MLRSLRSPLRHLGFAARLIALPLFGACATPEDGEDVGSIGEAANPKYGCDYSFARPSPASLKAQGFTFAARYLSYTSGKNLTKPEANALIKEGIAVVSNWEAGAQDALGGYNTGKTHAQEAEKQALAAGMPATRPIYFSVDFDASEGQQATLNAYFDGVASVIGRNRTGAYGGYYVIKRLFDAKKITWGWQAYAWSGGNWDARAQFRQIQNGIDNDQLDKDEAIAADFGQWGIAPKPVTPTDNPPTGYLDHVGCDDVGGWSQDPDEKTKSIDVQVFFDGPSGKGHEVALDANIDRADLCTAIGSCDHGFSVASPYSLFDGKAHEVYAYGIDANGKSNAQLKDSPGKLTCPLKIPAGVTRWVTNPTSLADWKFDTYFDELPATKAQADAITEGPDLPAAPVLAQVKGQAAVYLVDGKFKHHVPSTTVLHAWRFDATKIEPKTQAEIDALITAKDVRARPTLVTDSKGKLLLIDDALPEEAAGAGGEGGAGGKAGAGGDEAGHESGGEGGSEIAGHGGASGSSGHASGEGGSAGHVGGAGGAHAGGEKSEEGGAKSEDPIALESSSETGGCNASGSSPGGASLVLLLGLARRRRKAGA